MLYLWLIILSVGGDIPVDGDALLVTDFVNLKIKTAQSFKCTHRGRMCVCVHISEWSYIYEYLYLYIFSKKNKNVPDIKNMKLPTRAP
jgi:hypothetical protein